MPLCYLREGGLSGPQVLKFKRVKLLIRRKIDELHYEKS